MRSAILNATNATTPVQTIVITTALNWIHTWPAIE